MYVNKTLIIGTIIIIAGGTYNALVVQAKGGMLGKPFVTRVFVGGYLVALILSVADLFQPLQGLAGAFLMLAVTTVLFVILPDFAKRVLNRGA